MAPPSALAQRKINKWGARVVPLVLIGLVGYATWVVPVSIGVYFLLHPPPDTPRRTSSGIAIIVVYFFLMALMALAYARVLYQILTKPGFVPMEVASPPAARARNEKSARPSTANDSSEANTTKVDYLDRAAVHHGRLTPPGGMELFYKRDIFECEIDGMPRWCSHCKIWKPDRSHHSSEVGRCVYRMDHFCPWAGGIISETNFKFFVQFCFYAAVYCAFSLSVIAYFTAKRNQLGDGFDVNWILIMALCGLFLLFSFGMFYNSAIATFVNTTTVDNLTRAMRVQHFAVLMPHWHPLTRYEQERRVSADPDRNSPPPEATTPYPTITFPLREAGVPAQESAAEVRVFAILPTPTGSNPYKLESWLENWKSVMGSRWFDWFLPIRHSPCWEHGGLPESAHQLESGATVRRMYTFGPVLENMIRNAGLLPASEKFVATDGDGRRSVKERTPLTR